MLTLALQTPKKQQTFEQKLVSKKKLVVVLVGLPARGKSYISHRLVNYLNWVGIRCKLFNVGAARRSVSALRGSDLVLFASTGVGCLAKS
jgi:adenylylsulfate kinase-like enzyme